MARTSARRRYPVRRFEPAFRDGFSAGLLLKVSGGPGGGLKIIQPLMAMATSQISANPGSTYATTSLPCYVRVFSQLALASVYPVDVPGIQVQACRIPNAENRSGRQVRWSQSPAFGLLRAPAPPATRPPILPPG